MVVRKHKNWQERRTERALGRMIKFNASVGALYVTKEQSTARRKDPVTSKTDSLHVLPANLKPAVSLLSQVTVGKLSRGENDRTKREVVALSSKDGDYED
jgi:hypothetical protein